MVVFGYWYFAERNEASQAMPQRELNKKLDQACIQGLFRKKARALDIFYKLYVSILTHLDIYY